MAPSATDSAPKSASEISFHKALAFQSQMIAKSLEDPETSFSKRASKRAFCWVRGCAFGSNHGRCELSKHFKAGTTPHPEETYHPSKVIEVEYSEWLSDTGLMATAQATTKAEFDALLAQNLASNNNNNNNISAASTTTTTHTTYQPATDEGSAAPVNPSTSPSSPLSSLDSSLSSINEDVENADADGNDSEDAGENDSTDAGDTTADSDQDEEDEDENKDKEGDGEDTVATTKSSSAEPDSDDSNLTMKDAPAATPTSKDDTMADLEAKMETMQKKLMDMANQMAALATEMGEVTKSMAAMKKKQKEKEDGDAGAEHSGCGDSMSLVDDFGDLKV